MTSQERRTIIADVERARALRYLPRAVFIAAAVVGTAAAWYFHRLGLTLAHHDARAHLVVARRVTDNLTPGWQQVGGLWLPLPHLLNLIPIQWEWNYRTGFSAIALSIVALAWGLGALARYLLRHTGSVAAAVAGPALVLLNPNVLYLQSTPMTEPLLFGLALVSLDRVDEWVSGARRTPVAVWWALAAFVLVRYEAWPVAAALLLVAAFAGRSRAQMVQMAQLASGPFVAAAGFLALSKASVGQWFVSSGFFVADNPARGHAWQAVREMVASSGTVIDVAVLAAAAGGLAWCVRVAVAERSARALLPWALLATAAVPLAAFYSGHPFRVRYVAPLTVGTSVLAALALTWLPSRFRSAAAVALVGLSVWLNPPLGASSPILVEAQIDTPLREARTEITAILAARPGHELILASMQSLAHYMQETAVVGLHVEDYLHEGNGDLWTGALLEPRRYVRWILIEERAGGGDILAERARTHPEFLDGFTRLAEGGGLALYVRDEER